MIWALAGLGADYSTYNAGYTPAQRDAPVRPTTLVERTGTPTFKIPENAYVPPVEVPQQAETPWALVGLVVLGLGVAYASYKGDEARFEPNKKRKRRQKYARGVTGKTIVDLHLHKAGPGPFDVSLKAAYAALKKAGLKPGRIRRSTLRDGRKTWGITVKTTMKKAVSFQRKIKHRGYESFID